MNDTTRADAGDDLILLAIAGAWLALEAAATLTVALVALLLVLAGWRLSQAAAAVAQASVPCAESDPLPVVITPMPQPLAPAADPVAALTVAELRQHARAAGLAQLARSGRRAQLLEALTA